MAEDSPGEFTQPRDYSLANPCNDQNYLVQKRLRHHDGEFDLIKALFHKRLFGGKVAIEATAAEAAAAASATTDAAAAEAVGRASAPRPAHGAAPGLAERPVRRAHPALAPRVRGQRAEQPLRPQPRLQEQLFRRPTRPPPNSDGEFRVNEFSLSSRMGMQFRNWSGDGRSPSSIGSRNQLTLLPS